MRWLAERLMRLLGWRIEGEVPPEDKFVAIGAPHTSNWDFVIFLGVVSHFRIRARAIGKATLVRWPFGQIMRRLGIIPVERGTGQGMVGQMVREFAASDSMALVIAPEGTRKPAEYWRSGFYQIAMAADVPIALAYIDGDNKVAGVGPALCPSGDIQADMAKIRDFYAPFRGLRPERRGPVRLRPER